MMTPTPTHTPPPAHDQPGATETHPAEPKTAGVDPAPSGGSDQPALPSAAAAER